MEARAKAEYTGSSFWKPKAGDGVFVDNYVRVLPPVESMEGKLAQPAPLHWLPNKTAILCPRMLFAKPCPICDEGFDLLRRRKQEVDVKQAKDEARPYWPTWTFYANVVVLNKDGTPVEDQVQIWSMNKDAADLLIDLLRSADNPDDVSQIDDFTDALTGFDLKVRVKKTRDGEWDKHDYIIVKAPSATPFNYPELLAQRHDLTTVNPLLSAPEMVGLMAGDPLVQVQQGGGNDPLALPEGAVEPVQPDRWGAADNNEPMPAPEPAKPAGRKKAKADEGAAAERRARLRKDLGASS